MKKINWLISLFCLLISCEQRPHPAPIATAATTQKEAIPSQALQSFVKKIAKLGWIPDATRLQKVKIYPELNQKSVQYFEAHPFYPIDFKNSSIYKTYTSMSKGAPNFEIFQGVKYIWGYFYKDKKAKGMLTDGVIEEWTFETEEAAKMALKQLLSPKFIVYFNTTPYYCRLTNKVVIFQTRASAFSYQQKAVFEVFTQSIGAIID